ncbi:acyltransferase [Pontibacter mangrovi]|uniref:Acyltransferase n=1 Tax=Pontibacter mangrovi TaxID=2589816 RepID=A0A501VUB3_9BACT|nr:acyltransferase [Pontibacter mangrovi]TPE39985.1 acyltransferase [Pontibacter mangrovi]
MKKRAIKFLFRSIRLPLWYISMEKCSKFQFFCLKEMGVKFNGKPRYLSAKVWFDGTDYSLIKIGNNVTISSNIRILTHDWALDTIYQGYYGTRQDKPLGRTRAVEIGDSCFIGTGSLILPGTKLGKCCIVGAGAVVRGHFPDGSIIVGNPGKAIEINSKEYLNKFI